MSVEKPDADGLFVRHPDNPILTCDDWPYRVNAVFNPGATLLPDGETLLLVRVEDHSGRSHITAARSADGVSDWRVADTPALLPTPDRPEEAWGVEDARITFVPELGRFAVTYTAYSRSGPLVALAFTEDFVTFEHLGPALPPENKDAAIFPTRFGGRWAMIHRPVASVPAQKADIWLSFSPDLRHWGDHGLLFEAGEGGTWDADRIGLSPPPVLTDAGWLIVFHGVKFTAAGPLYRLGLALLDRDDPRIILARHGGWVFAAAAPYERVGDIPNVVFPCGATVHGDELRLYYGAAESSVSLATGKIPELLAFLRR